MIYFDNKFTKYNLGISKDISPSDLQNSCVVFLNGKHDKFKSKKYGGKEQHYIIKKCQNGFLFGNYIGEFIYQGREFKIASRYGDILLKNMLQSVSSGLFQNIKISSALSQNSTKNLANSTIEQVLYLAFLKELKRAKLKGTPSYYQKCHTKGFNGSIDMPKFIKKDLPLKGKFNVVKNELVYDRAIFDMLLKAFKIVIKHCPDFEKIDKTLRIFLTQNSSGKSVDNATMQRAFNSKALKNPMFLAYKKALNLARTIILKDDFRLGKGVASRSKNLSIGYLLYAPELFENYVQKLIQDVLDEINDGFVLKKSQQKVNCCLKPDFVIEKGNIIKLVLDAKYRHFYDGYLRENDLDNLKQIDKYIDACKVKTGVLIYAKSATMQQNTMQKRQDKKKIYILPVLNDKDNFSLNFSEYLKNIIKGIK